MSKKTENQGFVCENCGQKVISLSDGGYRNHCPECLYSLHIDILPGDRECDCHGLMKPENIVYNSKKGYQIIHKCVKCGLERANVISRDSVQPDNFELILRIMSEM